MNKTHDTATLFLLASQLNEVNLTVNTKFSKERLSKYEEALQ